MGLGRKGLGKEEPRGKRPRCGEDMEYKFLQTMWPEALYPVSLASVSLRVRCDETDLRIKIATVGKDRLAHLERLLYRRLCH